MPFAKLFIFMTETLSAAPEIGSGHRDVLAPNSEGGCPIRRSSCGRMEIVLRTKTPEGVEVVLPALVYAKILEQHAAVADLDAIDRTIREPLHRRPDVRPGRERFFRREGDLWILSVVEFGEVPAIIVTVFSARRPPA